MLRLPFERLIDEIVQLRRFRMRRTYTGKTSKNI